MRFRPDFNKLSKETLSNRFDSADKSIEELMTSIRYPILVFFLTLLAANHLGAKNDRGYRTGQQALKSRADF